jgi:hypothetical protein
MAKKKVPSDRVSHEHLGRMMQNIYESGYINRNTMYKMSFLKGVASGVGGVVGATIVIGLLLWVLSLFDQTPVVGPLFDNLQQTIESKSQ